MMKFLVGYQQMNSSELIDEVIKHKEKISELYFSWGGFANGRNSQLLQKDKTPWEAQQKLEEDIKAISEAGIPLNLLFNAMCYGKRSQSRSFFEEVGETVDYINSRFKLVSVTTTSPLIARFLKQNFEKLDIRASVNMGIGTIEGMDYIKDYFDSFYVARELNRDFATLAKIKEWCDANGKKLYGLANSGCLNNCSAHTFHDNLVAHESEISQMDNGYAFEGICGQYLKKPDNHKALLENTSYIRPEDIEHYDSIFSALKLATRVNSNPVRVLKAYIEGKHNGSVLDLLEPNHTGLIYPYLLENKKINSQVCNQKLVYSGLEDALIRLEEDIC